MKISFTDHCLFCSKLLLQNNLNSEKDLSPALSFVQGGRPPHLKTAGRGLKPRKGQTCCGPLPGWSGCSHRWGPHDLYWTKGWRRREWNPNQCLFRDDLLDLLTHLTLQDCESLLHLWNQDCWACRHSALVIRPSLSWSRVRNAARAVSLSLAVKRRTREFWEKAETLHFRLWFRGYFRADFNHNRAVWYHPTQFTRAYFEQSQNAVLSII